MRPTLVIAAMLVALTGAQPADAQVSDPPCGAGTDTRRVARAFDDLRVCIVAQTYSGAADDHAPSEWVRRSPHTVLETRRPNDVRRMEVAGLTVTWTVNGVKRGVDSTADAWRLALLAVLDTAWGVDYLHGTAVDLEARIAAMPAQRDSVQAQIQGVKNRVAEKQNQITALETSERTMRANISASEQQQRQIERQITSQESALAAVDGKTTADAMSRANTIRSTIKRLEDQSRSQEQQTRTLERQLAAQDPLRKADLIALDLKGLDADNTITWLNVRLGQLDSTHVEELRSRVRALDADRRVADLEPGLKSAVARLRVVLGSNH